MNKQFTYDPERLKFSLTDDFENCAPEDVYELMAAYCLDTMTKTMQYWTARDIVKFYHKNFLS